VQDKLEQLDRPGSNRELAAAGSGGIGGSGGGAPGLQHQQLGASLAADAALQRQLQAQTPEALSSAALGEAKAIVAACRGKISESATEASAASPAAAAGDAPAVASGQDWGSAEGQRLSGLIEGCVHSLVLLQQGAESAALPAATLAAALDGALLAVQPHSAANRQLYAEIQAAMQSLKLQISAAS
jgi:hypothetical protein